MSESAILCEAIRIASRLGTTRPDHADAALSAFSAVPECDLSRASVASILEIPLGVLDFFVCCAEEFDRTRRGADSGYSSERIAELARILGEEASVSRTPPGSRATL